MKTRLTSSITEAAAEIKKGNAVAFPTETVYGLGANAFDAQAVKKIFEAKHRPADNPLIVHISDKKQLGLVATSIPQKAGKLVEKFFPGPLSIVLKRNKKIPSIVSAGLPTVCVRMPSLPITRKFISACGVPVAAPSANKSGSPSPTTWRHVMQDLEGKIPLILKGPRAIHGLESTVIDCTGKTPRLLRAGSIPVEKIERVIGRVKKQAAGRALSPGMRYKHYSPKARVTIVRDTTRLPVKGNWAFIGFETAHRAVLSKKIDSPEEYAKQLFGFMRECDEKKISTIYAQAVEEKGLGRAIMDRLKRASQA